MSEGSEITKALCRVVAEIADKEKREAIKTDDYGTALIAGFVEGLFKEAENSIK